jgi:tungstate transport system substrate-binding protein
MKPTQFFAAAFVALLGHAGLAAGPPASESITLASTTSVENSGLLAQILPTFTRGTGITVRVLALGTGRH